jgi:glutathione synthase
MAQRHLFILDPLERLNFALDSSLQMAMSLRQMGHRVYQTESSKMSWHRGAVAAGALAREITFRDRTTASIELGHPEQMFLSDFNGIHMRKEPPFNMDYITSTWLLDSVAAKTWIFNAPGALRSVNEKLSIFQFPEATNPAIVSANPDDLMDFYENVAMGDAIVKPLDLFGGRGIFRLNRASGERDLAREDLTTATERGTVPRLMQKFDVRIYEGEVRVFTLGGKALSWCLKVPSPGNFLANTARGAVLKYYQPAPALREMIETVAQKLCTMGIFLAGFDVIGDKISEINITSPRLLRAEGDNSDYYGPMADWFAKKCEAAP